LTEEDHSFLTLKDYGAKRLIKEFPTKGWKKKTLKASATARH